METTKILVACLILSSAITEDEAGRLTKELQGQMIGSNWREVVKQIEKGIGRKIHNVKYKI